MAADKIALLYLARGSDADQLVGIRRFVQGYRNRPAGVAHELVVIFCGFESEGALDTARAEMAGIAYREIYAEEEAYDFGAYAKAILRINCERTAFLNTGSEPVASEWLHKLNAAVALPGVGLVGASGSFEARVGGLAFPNVHVRANAFMMRTALARRTIGRTAIRNESDARQAEHGLNSLTRQVVSHGLTAVIVGANGRAYAPEWWSGSRTFRQGNQANLLVADNETRAWDTLTWPERRIVHEITWGAIRSPTRPFGNPRS